MRLDYVFVPVPLVDSLTSCEIVDGSNAVPASDHFPLLAELDVH